MNARGVFLIVACTASVAGCNLLLGAPDYEVGKTSTASSTSAAGGSSSVSSGAGGSVAHGVAVSPQSTTALPLTGLDFSATIGGVPSAAVTWSVLEANGGSVTTLGAYSAPMAEGAYHVRASNNADSTDFADATIVVKASADPVMIAPDGDTGNPTGLGVQRHLAYAQGSGQWWYFFDGSMGNSFQTKHSKDFVDWQQGEGLMPAPPNSPYSNSGRDFSVASRNINGHDVVHITQGVSGFRRLHIRAVETNGHLVYDPPVVLNTSMGDAFPDGPATTILGDGTVIDATGWQALFAMPPLLCGGPGGTATHGDMVAYSPMGWIEDGTQSVGSVQFTQQVLWCAQIRIKSRALLDAGQYLVAVNEVGPTEGDLENLIASTRLPTGDWQPTQVAAGPLQNPPTVFSLNKPFHVDDWAGAVAGGSVHVVRRGDDGSFDHAFLGADGQWLIGPPIPAPASTTDPNSGLFLTPYGNGVLLVALSAASVVYTFYDNAEWTPWQTLIAPLDHRSELSGFSPPPPSKPAIIWNDDLNVDGALLP